MVQAPECQHRVAQWRWQERGELAVGNLKAIMKRIKSCPPFFLSYHHMATILHRASAKNSSLKKSFVGLLHNYCGALGVFIADSLVNTAVCTEVDLLSRCCHPPYVGIQLPAFSSASWLQPRGTLYISLYIPAFKQ